MRVSGPYETKNGGWSGGGWRKGRINGDFEVDFSSEGGVVSAGEGFGEWRGLEIGL